MVLLGENMNIPDTVDQNHCNVNIGARMSKSVLLSGTEAAAEIRNSLKLKVLDIQKNDPTFLPKLVIVQVTFEKRM